MRKILLLGVAGAALATAPALGAEIPVSNWTGFYAGLQAGYGWSNGTVDLTPASTVTTSESFVPAFFLLFPVGVSGVAGASTVGAVPTSFKTDPRGSHVGFLLGWDWQFARRLVAGLEADLSDSNQRGK